MAIRHNRQFELSSLAGYSKLTEEEHGILGDGRLPDADIGMVLLGDELEALISVYVCRD